ncbi:MAG: hypothetical protein WD555_02000 [Fulvivirga sp.]
MSNSKMINTNVKQFQIVLILLLSTFIFSSCKQKQAENEKVIETPDEVEKMRNEVMAIHDEVMPEMGALMNLKKQLKAKINQMDSTEEKTDSLQPLVIQLEEADEAMMQWMRSYKEPSAEMSQDEAMEYLQVKKKEILEVKKKIKSSKAAAKVVLENK